MAVVKQEIEIVEETYPDHFQVNIDWLPPVFGLIYADSSSISGYVTSEEDLQAVLQAHEKNTESVFHIDTDDQKKRMSRQRRFFYGNRLLEIYTHLSSNDRCRTYMCKFGMRYKPYKGKEADQDPPVKRNKNYLTTSKTGCPAKIYVNEVSVYTDYKVIGITMKERQEKLKLLKKDIIERSDELKVDKYYHVRLPLKSAHEGHVVSMYHAKAGKTHPGILKKCQELTLNGITNTKIQKVILKKYAEDIILKGNMEEVTNESYYFPSEKVIANKIRSVIYKTRGTDKHQSELLQVMKSLQKKKSDKKTNKKHTKKTIKSESLQYEEVTF